jgi:hypothetical protein
MTTYYITIPAERALLRKKERRLKPSEISG